MIPRYGKGFIDKIRVFVKAGAGGHGLPKFGGVGGDGGDVCLEAVKFKGLDSFARTCPTRNIYGENGEDSKRNKIKGERGTDKVVKVPVGVIVYGEEGEKIGELDEEGETLKVASGGRGGSFYTTPKYVGKIGEGKTITLDLKLIADIGLVGFPNAGKSTLLKAISRANPKIADYAFTTLKPNLGILEYSDYRQISMADLPGLIEGASENIGMGHKFLRHIERTNLLLFVVDIDGFQYKPNMPHRSCLETIILLNKELELYDKALLKKPAVLAVNKMDKPDSDKKLKELLSVLKIYNMYVRKNIRDDIRPRKLVKFWRIIPISARYDENSIKELKNVLRTVLDDAYFRAMNRTLESNKKKLEEEFNKDCDQSAVYF